MSKYEIDNTVSFCKDKYGQNQRFVVNTDKTVSPTAAPNLVVGFKYDKLLLVDKND